MGTRTKAWIKEKYADKINTSNIEANEKGFLQMLNEYGAGDGVSLFRSNSDQSQWSRLSVDNFGYVSSYSCMPVIEKNLKK